MEARGQSRRRYTIFSQAAIRRALADSLGPGQQRARAIIEVAERVMANNNHTWICWVSVHRGAQSNETADRMAKEAASGQSDEVPDQVRWQTSLPHLARRTTEQRTAATSPYSGLEATEAVLKFLESTRVGCRASAETARLRMDEDRGGGDVWGEEGWRAGQARLRLCFCFLCFFPSRWYEGMGFFPCHLSSVSLFTFSCRADSGVGDRDAPV